MGPRKNIPPSPLLDPSVGQGEITNSVECAVCGRHFANRYALAGHSKTCGNSGGMRARPDSSDAADLLEDGKHAAAEATHYCEKCGQSFGNRPLTLTLTLPSSNSPNPDPSLNECTL